VCGARAYWCRTHPDAQGGLAQYEPNRIEL